MEEEATQHDYELVRFVFDLRKDDPLRMLVRAQAHIEQSLRQFILANAPSSRHFERAELDFEGVVRLALVLGLNEDMKPALTALGALQAKFVRSVDVRLGSQEADNFYNVLGPSLKQVLREVYQEFRIEQNLGEFKRQPASMRLVWFLIGIWSAILSDRKHGPIPGNDRSRLPVADVEDLENRRKAFFELLNDSDDMQLIIRGHGYLERELREFVATAARQPAAVKPSDYDYAGTLRLALILGLDESLEASLAAIGSLRNKFAHRIDMELTEPEARQIYERLKSRFQIEAQKGWAAAFRKHPDTDRPENLLDAKPRDLVASSMAMLYLSVLREQLKKRRGTLERSRRPE